MNKETYFKMVDQKQELDRKIEILYKAYQNIWAIDSTKKINANLKWSDILRNRRDELVKEMTVAREGIKKSILKEWKKEYGTTRNLV
jgi:hypothetical protein